MNAYPEHDKLGEIRDQSQAIGQFLESGPYVLAQYLDCDDYHLTRNGANFCDEGSHLVLVDKSINEVLAEHFGIDLAVLEAEKRAMLEQIRSRS